MGQQSYHEVAKTPISVPCAVLTIIQFLITDIVIYGLIIPVLGALLGGYCANKCGLSPKYELVLIVLFTFTLTYGAFCLVGETGYWKHLFAFDKFYCFLLQIRDGINVSLIIVSLLGLHSTIEIMVNKDKEMKMEHVSEGVVYVFLKWICRWLYVDESILYSIGFKAPNAYLPSFGEQERLEHGATYMLFWGILTAGVAKMIYFNTLFTYIRAMEIFLSMNPIFGDEDLGTSSTEVFKLENVRRSQLEKNFARSVKKLP